MNKLNKARELEEQYKEWSGKKYNLVYSAPDEVFEFFTTKLEKEREKVVEIIEEAFGGVIDFYGYRKDLLTKLKEAQIND